RSLGTCDRTARPTQRAVDDGERRRPQGRAARANAAARITPCERGGTMDGDVALACRNEKGRPAMRIVVIGGTGLIGSKLVQQLQNHGHEAVAASPTTGVNTITGVGLTDALAGAQVVVDVADAPSFADDAVLEHFMTSGRNLASAEARLGVTHHIALSVVGADRLQHSGYMRAKVAQEALVRAEGIPYT